MSSSTRVRKRAQQLKGRPVRVTLHDGRSYVGWISGIEKQGLILSEQRSPRKSTRNSHSHSQKATVSGLMPLFGSLLGNAGGIGAAGAGTAGSIGFLGMIQKAVPFMQMGYKMIRTIMPLMGGLKGLIA
ncbi:small nuclear ribonucleoprotein (snRNP)-like protein [Paenibacillus sp. DS2015]|uniref:hypothetical protein n=1 Tax=Paenibacillus sp. DS2015 TaxID=3373917 RepID=UPI003D1947AB